MDHLLARFRRHELEAEHARILARILLESGADLEAVRPNPRACPNDRERLRGLPAVGRGVGGTMRGTQPEQETIRRLTGR